MPFLPVEYGVAPEFSGGRQRATPFAALQWLPEHADELDVDPARVAILGDSGGGGVGAGAAILARAAWT